MQRWENSERWVSACLHLMEEQALLGLSVTMPCGDTERLANNTLSYKKTFQWSLYFTLGLCLFFLCYVFSIPLVCQIHCEVPPRLYVLETALFVPFSTELQGVCWIWDCFFLWFYVLKVLLQLSKEVVKHRINIELSILTVFVVAHKCFCKGVCSLKTHKWWLESIHKLKAMKDY